ncbi:histidine kinase [Kribbella albertanoniae]|uniref:histidine kinase n=1 Tax=Kribbella albertanoniae TaxID=1266829 RepID=A0A4R4PGW1_9ACTN|nr:histidine kinase [Kribbella albertanoniae]TDC21138.1 histidine kinase [Kribbella albertanoniae]
MRARVVDGVLMVVCLAAALWPGLQSGLFDGFSPWLEWRVPDTVQIAMGVITAAVVPLRRRWPALLSVAALGTWGLATGWPPILIAQYGVGAYLRSVRIQVGLSVLTVGAVAWPLWRVAGADGSLPLSVMLCVLPAVVGLYLTSRRAVVAGLEERAQRNEREQQLRIDQARSQERAQIARDMHDVVTHRVSLMVLHATALEADDRDRAELAHRIQDIGRSALDELRTLVGVLRDESDAPLAPQPGLSDLPELVTTWQQAGLDITLDLPSSIQVSALVEHAVYRVVQEALTNAHRHAPGAKVRVEVTHAEGELGLLIRNQGGQAQQNAGTPGYGLLGISERVRLVGGELTTRRTDDTFEVAARIPGTTR